MANIRNANDIIQSLIDLFKVLQPDMDTKPGAVARDLFIEAPANQLSLLYEELSKISALQSLRLAIGADLDKLAQNFGAVRRSASKSTGIALLTFNSIPTAISIDKGSLIFSSNGFSFTVLNGTSVTPANSNLYKSIATKYKTDLDFIGITDQYAVEVSVEATTPGTAGNISKYSLNRTTIPGVSNITNINPITGGTNQEDDSTFRNRVLSIFSGSSVGTSLGYKNIALSDSGVLDALVIGPGDSLMVRDGTQVSRNSDGSYTIISEGQGGKIDIVILGSRLDENIDSFIYRDLSNNNDPSDDKNIIVLGQMSDDVNKTITKKRIDNFKNGELPAQPVESVLEVSGSLSGSNFKEMEVDSLGRISGNYEIVKDTGVYSGSPFGFDKFRWISNKISLFGEDRIKSSFNSQDNVTFTDVLSIPKVQQNIQITNENSIVSNSDRSIIQLLHMPATSITRIFNTNTGERYTIIDQNLDGDDTINTTGRVKISGNSLPSSSDILQVDYTWILDYDPCIDYDGKLLNNNPRVTTTSDSIDWGYSNLVRSEVINLTRNSSSSFFSGTTTHAVTSVISLNTFSQEESAVSIVRDTTSPLNLKKIVTVNSLVAPIDNIESILLANTNKECYNILSNDGSFSNTKVIIGSKIRYNATIVLPSDCIANEFDEVTVIFNISDIFTIDGTSGNFSNNQITIPVTNFSTTSDIFKCRCTYISNVQDLLTTSISSLPISRAGNGYILKNKVGFNNTIISNISRREHQTVAKNSDNKYYVKLSISSLEFSLTASNIISSIRLSDNLELSNNDNQVTVSIDTDGYYLAVFNDYNTPVTGDKVLVIYYADDLKRNQPVSFSNKIIRSNIDSLQYDTLNDEYFLAMHQLTEALDQSFTILDSTNDSVYASVTDGYITTSFGSENVGYISSSTNFSSIENITSKKLKIFDSLISNNNGLYDITDYDSITNTLTITNILSNITSNQISIIRISDGQELWNSSGEIVIEENKLILPGINFPSIEDNVIIIYYINNNLRQAPTRLSVNIADQINTSGVLTISGRTLKKVENIVFTVTNDGLKHNVFDALRTFLGLNSNASIPSTIKIARLVALEKVETTTNDEVLSVLTTFDVKGYNIKNNILYENEAFYNEDLGDLEFIIPSTVTNTDNEPKSGDNLRITFYYTTDSDYENLFFTRNGTIYTNKIFTLIDSVYISSGFTKSQSTRITISNFNQPLSSSRYKSFYDYLAPKQNERIIIRYNFNKLISDVSFNIESQRPLNADVIVRAAKKINVDVTMNIVIKQEFLDSGSSQIVAQNLKDKIISALNVNVLESIIDSSDLINVAYSVDGIDRSRIIYFNKSGEAGQVLSLTAQKDEYFVANNVIINIETRS